MQYNRKQPEVTNQKALHPQASQRMVNGPRKPETGKEDKTRTERIIERIKRNPVILILSTVMLIIGVVATLLGNINTIETTWRNWFPSPATPATAVQFPPFGPSSCISQEHKGPVSAVAWSPDGRYIASAGKDETVQIWDTTTCKKIAGYRNGSMNSISWSPDGNRLVSGGDDTPVQVWLADTGSLLYIYTGCAVSCVDCGHLFSTSFKRVSSVAWSPDGNYIAFGSLDGHIRVFDANTGACTFALDNQGPVKSVAWSTDSQYIAFGGGVSGSPTIQLWDIKLNLMISKYSISGYFPDLYDMGMSPDGKHIIATWADGTLDFVRMWNIINGKFVPSSMWYSSHEDFWGSIVWACDSQHVVLEAGYGKVEIFDTSKGHLIYTYYTTPVTAIALSPDGTRAASADANGVVRIWQASQKKLC